MVVTTTPVAKDGPASYSRISFLSGLMADWLAGTAVTLINASPPITDCILNPTILITPDLLLYEPMLSDSIDCSPRATT